MQWTKMTASQKAAAEALRDELFAAGVETSKSALAKEFDTVMAYRRGEITLAALCEAIGADMPAAEEPAAVESADATETAWVSFYDQEAPGVDGVDLNEVAHVLPMADILATAEKYGFGTDRPDLYALVSADPDAGAGAAVAVMVLSVSRVAVAEIRGAVYAASRDNEPMSRDDVADLLGLEADTISRYMVDRSGENPFPEPSGRIGRSPWWSASRAGEILAWAARRPGRTGRPRKTAP